MSETGVLIFFGCINGVAVLGAVIAVSAAVSGASAAHVDDEETTEEQNM